MGAFLFSTAFGLLPPASVFHGQGPMVGMVVLPSQNNTTAMNTLATFCISIACLFNLGAMAQRNSPAPAEARLIAAIQHELGTASDTLQVTCSAFNSSADSHGTGAAQVMLGSARHRMEARIVVSRVSCGEPVWTGALASAPRTRTIDAQDELASRCAEAVLNALSTQAKQESNELANFR